MVKKVKYSFPHFSVFVGLWPYFHSRRCTNSGWLFILLSRFASLRCSAGWTADWMAGRLAAWHIYRKTGKTTETRPGDVIIILCAPKIRVRVPQLRPLYHLFASWAPVFWTGCVLYTARNSNYYRRAVIWISVIPAMIHTGEKTWKCLVCLYPK